MGSTKTYTAVKKIISKFRQLRLMKFLHLIDFKPEVYSNIPIALKRVKTKHMNLLATSDDLLTPDELLRKNKLKEYHEKRKSFSKVLEREHLLMQKRIEENALICIDDLSAFINQWTHDNPNCQLTFGELLRFIRHYMNTAGITITAQATGEVLIDIRRKINIAYELSNFRRFFIFFYKVDVTEVKFTEEIVTIENNQDIDHKPYFFGVMPFKYLTFFNKIFYWWFTPRYDTRCYSENYPVKDLPLNDFRWHKLKTNYFIQMDATIEQMTKYKLIKKNGMNREAIKNYNDELLK
jgi:hypothetical protein